MNEEAQPNETYNDVHSPDFVSKLDPYFKSDMKELHPRMFRFLDAKVNARSALALTRPIK